MDNVKKIYSDSFKKHGNSLESIFIPKGRQKERFDSLAGFCKNDENETLLDFGCGLGHLHQYVKLKLSNLHYSGCDIVDEFVVQCKQNYPEGDFYKIDKHTDIKKRYDYIIAAGVFNLLYSPNIEEHKTVVYETLIHLFDKTSKVLSVNFMTDDVDFIAEGAYHQNIPELINIVTKQLSKRFVIDQSYMPYEYTIHIFKDDVIMRPDNVFKNL